MVPLRFTAAFVAIVPCHSGPRSRTVCVVSRIVWLPLPLKVSPQISNGSFWLTVQVVVCVALTFTLKRARSIL